MAPNWFIAFPMQVEGLHLPPAPRRVRVFGADDLHLTLCFFGSVQEAEARRAWDGIDRFNSLRSVEGTFAEIKPLGHPKKPSALTAIVGEGRDAFCEMIMEARRPLLEEAGARPDERSPLPHMTFARIQRRADAAERRAAVAWLGALDLSGVRFTATDVALYTWSTERERRLFDVVARRPVRA